MPPDCDSAENLRRKLEIASRLGARRADFYHYGLAPLSALDLIRDAVSYCAGTATARAET